MKNIYLHIHLFYWLSTGSMYVHTIWKDVNILCLFKCYFSESDGQKKQGPCQILEDPNTQKSTIGQSVNNSQCML